MKTVKVTSKNQITLPADYVRQLGWEHQRLQVKLQGKELIFSKERDLRDRLSPVWQEAAHYTPKPVSDEALTQGLHDHFSKKAI